MISRRREKETINIKAFHQGSVDAFEVICYRYLQPLTRYCRILVRDEDIASEIVSIILAKSFTNRQLIHSEKQLRQFLRDHALMNCKEYLNKS